MKKVYILGAGFSVQGGIPILKEFFKEVRNKRSQVIKESKNEPIRFDYVLEFEEYLFKKYIKGKEPETPNMESAFKYIEKEFRKNKDAKLGGFDISNEKLRTNLLWVMCKTFHL